MSLVPSFHMPRCTLEREKFATQVLKDVITFSLCWKSSFSNLLIFFSQAIKNMRDSTGDTRNAGVRCLRISPDGQALATGDRSGNVRFVFENSQLSCVHRPLSNPFQYNRDYNFRIGLKP